MDPLYLLFFCPICRLLLHHSITLPCGSTICNGCFPRPQGAHQDAARITQRTSADASSAASDASSLIFYQCPVTSCNRRHQYRSERPDVLVSNTIEKYLPHHLTIGYRRYRDATELASPYIYSHSVMASLSSEYTEQHPSDILVDLFSHTSLHADNVERKRHLIEADSRYQECISTLPHFDPARLGRARVLAALGRWGDALSETRNVESSQGKTQARRLVKEIKELAAQQGVNISPTTSLMDSLGSSDDDMADINIPPRSDSHNYTLRVNKTHSSNSSHIMMSTSPDRYSLYSVSHITPHQPVIPPKPIIPSHYKLDSTDSIQPNAVDFECLLCYNLLHDPISTPCGHTWCRSCLLESLDHNRKCPLCRTSLPTYGHFSRRQPNWILNKIITTYFAETVELRNITLNEKVTGPSSWIPMFVCTLVYPGMPCCLHIFEPRYRILVKRALDSDRRFGVVLPGSGNNGTYVDYGTMVEIRRCEPINEPGADMIGEDENRLPRYMVETIGVYRFKVLERRMSSVGYAIARIERIEDIDLEEEDPAAVLPAGSDAPFGRWSSYSTGTTSSSSSRASSSQSIIRHSDHESVMLTRPTLDSDKQHQHHTQFVRSNEPLQHHIIQPQQSHFQYLVTKALNFINSYLGSLTEQARIAFERQHGLPPSEPADLPFWLASLLPITPARKYELLKMQSVVVRMEKVGYLIDRAIAQQAQQPARNSENRNNNR